MEQPSLEYLHHEVEDARRLAVDLQLLRDRVAVKLLEPGVPRHRERSELRSLERCPESKRHVVFKASHHEIVWLSGKLALLVHRPGVLDKNVLVPEGLHPEEPGARVGQDLNIVTVFSRTTKCPRQVKFTCSL